LCYGDSVGREAVLVGQHRWVQILASVRPFSMVSRQSPTKDVEHLT
jgi:hypothetical protein